MDVREDDGAKASASTTVVVLLVQINKVKDVSRKRKSRRNIVDKVPTVRSMNRSVAAHHHPHPSSTIGDTFGSFAKKDRKQKDTHPSDRLSYL